MPSAALRSPQAYAPSLCPSRHPLTCFISSPYQEKGAAKEECKAYCEPMFERSKEDDLCYKADCAACGFCSDKDQERRSKDSFGWGSVDDPKHPEQMATKRGWGGSDPENRPGR